MSGAVVAGATVWAQTAHRPNQLRRRRRRCRLRSTRGPWLASVRAPTAGGAGTEAGRPPRGLERAAGIERQRRRQHGGRGPCALQAGRWPAPGGARTRICPAADRSESSRRPGNHRSPAAQIGEAGPSIDTFLSSMLMSQIDGRASTPALNARVRKALQKTVAKIEKSAVGRKLEHCWRLGAGARHRCLPQLGLKTEAWRWMPLS